MRAAVAAGVAMSRLTELLRRVLWSLPFDYRMPHLFIEYPYRLTRVDAAARSTPATDQKSPILADVIKIESLAVDARHRYKPIQGGERPHSYALNRDERSVVLEQRTERARCQSEHPMVSAACSSTSRPGLESSQQQRTLGS